MTTFNPFANAVSNSYLKLSNNLIRQHGLLTIDEFKQRFIQDTNTPDLNVFLLCFEFLSNKNEFSKFDELENECNFYATNFPELTEIMNAEFENDLDEEHNLMNRRNEIIL
jgi:hypothetical protein